MNDTAQFQIRHVTGFNYGGMAESSYNEARMTPQDSSHQKVLEATILVTPGAVQSTYRDYFDTVVTSFDLHEPHDRLEVVAVATVQTFNDIIEAQLIALTSLRESHVVDQFAEYLAPTPRTFISTEVLDEVDDLKLPRDDVHETVRQTVTWVQDRVAYVRGSTHVSSTAQEVWEQRQGVCQDLSHVTISLLRGMGIPARYVSGYLHSDPEAAIGETIIGESHAWVEYFGGAWVGIDPTNASSIGLHHVMVARGREYGDVPPLKGIYHGGPSSAVGVVVEITRTK